MLDDIRPKRTPNHLHKWFLAQREKQYHPINRGNDRIVEKIEYAYLTCSNEGCEGIVKKVRVLEEEG